MIVRTHRAGFLFGGNVGFHLSFSHHGRVETSLTLLIWFDENVPTCAPRMGQQAHSPGQSEAAPRESNIANP
ncbi:hypothetical protein, partial [Xylanibacter rodentium]|uniref:hypothetical protein n=1 Tax=Xylanibacter rodentium TaxID=2736289 RepID=UPI00258C2142